MPEPVQGTAVLRKFVTIQSHKKMEEKNTNHVRMNGYSFLSIFYIKKPHRDATQRHQDVALNRFNFCYNTLFLSAGFSESDGIRIDQLLKFRHRHCHAIGGILNADRSFF